jgi:hypothetical protein
VGINIIDPTRSGIFVDPRIFENGRAIDSFFFNANRNDSRIGTDRINRPWNGNGLTGGGQPSAGPTCGEDGIGHATILIENYVFDLTDILALR